MTQPAAHPFHMRRATPADKAAVLALSHAVDPEDYIPYLYDDWMAAAEPEGLYVAEQDGRIIGCHAVEFPAPHEAYFWAMRIHPEVQGKGIGSRYCQAQVAHAAAAGARSIYLLSVIDNVRAHRTVEKNGFVNRGAWLIYDELKGLRVTGAAGAARPARPEDLPRLERYRRALPADGLSDVICAPSNPWTVMTMTPSDWSTGDLVVVDGAQDFAGVMLLRLTGTAVLIRRLEGTPEAARELLAYAVALAGRSDRLTLALSLPARSEPLLAPLELDPAQAFRAYVFHITPSLQV
jgi:GNAT superfamily N-acetyltransferase